MNRSPGERAFLRRFLRLAPALALATGLGLPGAVSAAIHTAILKITNPAETTSPTPVRDSDGDPWTQVYVEIPGRLFMDRGWLAEDLSNLRFVDETGLELSHWVPPKKDDNFRVDRLGVWLLLRDLAPGTTRTIRVQMSDEDTFPANPRAGDDTTLARASDEAASTVFPFYARKLDDPELDADGAWQDADTRFIDNTLTSEDDLRSPGADVKTGVDAVTGEAFTLTILNLKYWEHSQSEAQIYFLSQATRPQDLDTAPGYRLYLQRAADYNSVSDDLHYRRYHFIIRLQRHSAFGFWFDLAATDWYPYHNTRNRLDLKVGPETIALEMNGEQLDFVAGPFGTVSAGKYVRSAADWKSGRIGLDRRHWQVDSQGADIDYILLRRHAAVEPEFRIYGNTDLVLGEGSPDIGADITELEPSLQQVGRSVGGNTLDDYVFATFNVARDDQIIDSFKLELRNRSDATDTFDLSFVNSAPRDWLMYVCDEAGSACSLTPPTAVTLPAGGSIVYTLRMVPTPSALFEGSVARVDVLAESRGDASTDQVRFSAGALSQLGCFWQYRAPQTITWPGGSGHDNLYDYQVLVTIDGEASLDAARADGNDIVFTDAEGNSLDFWLKEFDQAARRLEAWVEVPLIEGSAGDTLIYAWWGNQDHAIGRSNAVATFDLWEDWTTDYALGQPVGCDDGTDACAGRGPDPHGWENVPTPDDDYNWWEIDEVDGIRLLQADFGGSRHSSDTGPYIHKGRLGWDHYEVAYRTHSGTYYQYSGGGIWGNPQFDPVFYNDAGNMWGMEYFQDAYIFRPYAAGIDYAWQYQTHARNIMGGSFPARDRWYWAKVRAFRDRDRGIARLRILMAGDEPEDRDRDDDYRLLADFDAPPAFGLSYGEIGFGGWDSGFGFTDIRVRKYIEDASGREPQVSGGAAETVDARGAIKLTRPLVTAPIFRGRPAYVEAEATPFAWRGDLKVYYADCYVNGDCRSGESQDRPGSISILGELADGTPRGVGWHLMRRDPGEDNGAGPGARTIYTSDGVADSLIDFGMSRCGLLQGMLGTTGACDPDDGELDATERLIRYVRGYYVAPQDDGLFSRSLSRNFDGDPGYGNDDGIPDPEEQWKLGDLLHSNPVQIGIPNMGYAEDDYWTDFVAAHDDRALVAYFMTNEGMLHAVRLAHWAYDPGLDAETYVPDTAARELWAYIPNGVLSRLAESTDASHEYLGDGLLRAIDIKIGGQWRTVLFGLLGRGGLAYFAMDVTDPESPRLLWERSGEHDRIGTTISAPALGKIDGEWVAVLGSGWDTDYANNFEGKQAWLTVIRLEDGVILKQLRVSDKVGNVLTDITPLRNPGDGTLDKIYFGDYYGALWRVSQDRLSSLADGSTLSPDRDALFVPDDYDSTELPTQVARPFTARPRVARGVGESEFWVYAGTGDYDEYDAAYPRQAFYALRDVDSPYAGDGDSRLENMTSSSSQNLSNRSWFILLGYDDAADYRLGSGERTTKSRNERVIRPAEVYGGYVFFTTFEPGDSPCGGGLSRFYGVDYRTGMVDPGLFADAAPADRPGDEVRSVELQASGIPSQPLILEGQSGEGSAIATGVTSNTSGELEKVQLNPNKFSTALDILLWREKR